MQAVYSSQPTSHPGERADILIGWLIHEADIS